MRVRSDSEVEKRATLLTTLFILVCCVVITTGFGLLGSNTKLRPLLRFCFNSNDQFVAGQCVLCDFYKFSATVLGCNGRTSALSSNISSTEAVCIISNCLQQVKQSQPQLTGRRRRDVDVHRAPAPIVHEGMDGEGEQGSTDPNDEEETTPTGYFPDKSEFVPLKEDRDEKLEWHIVDTLEVNIDPLMDEFGEMDEE